MHGGCRRCDNLAWRFAAWLLTQVLADELLLRARDGQKGDRRHPFLVSGRSACCAPSTGGRHNGSCTLLTGICISRAPGGAFSKPRRWCWHRRGLSLHLKAMMAAEGVTQEDSEALGTRLSAHQQSDREGPPRCGQGEINLSWMRRAPIARSSISKICKLSRFRPSGWLPPSGASLARSVDGPQRARDRCALCLAKSGRRNPDTEN